MAHQKLCEFCGGEMQKSELYCPRCGTYDQSRIDPEDRFTVIRPSSIEELSVYASEHGIPLQTLAFSIGEDHADPLMNGIYRDGEHVIVYENAPNGFRSIGYDGTNEEEAAELFFSHLMDECHARGIEPERMAGRNDQRISRAHSSLSSLREPRRRSLLAIAVILGIAAVAVTLVSLFVLHLNDGYYSDAGVLFYKDGRNWYYSTGASWVRYEAEDGQYPDEFLGGDFDPSWGGSEFPISVEDGAADDADAGDNGAIDEPEPPGGEDMD